jgi:hypothetical protein
VATVLFTALQSSPRDVIVAAAFPDSKLPLCRNAGAPGIKPQPDLTEADQVPAAVLFRFLGQRRLGSRFHKRVAYRPQARTMPEPNRRTLSLSKRIVYHS